jgi:urease accessory protein
VLREAARRLGAQLLRSAATVWPGDPIAAYRVASCLTPRPIALGVVAAAGAIADEDVALLALYDDAATVASAALKLLPLDPAVTARWLAELAPKLAVAARAVAADRGPLPAPAAGALELSAPIHLEQRERLFAS